MKYYAVSNPILITEIESHIERMQKITKAYPQMIGGDYRSFITLEKEGNGILVFDFKNLEDILKEEYYNITYIGFIKIIRDYEYGVKKELSRMLSKMEEESLNEDN